MKIVAFYLPQFHEVPRNSEWWGEGYTEWTNVRAGRPIYPGHEQTRVPKDRNYYDMTDVATLEWQALTAKRYGIFGFCYYHYWFEGELLLEKPAELMLKNPSVDIPFCFSWANHSWTRQWERDSDVVNMRQTYGAEEDWRSHFYYLLRFFKDERYMKEDGKPIMVLYQPRGVEVFPQMMQLWADLARDNGLPGIVFIHQQSEFDHSKEPGGSLFSYGIEFQPKTAMQEYRQANGLQLGVQRMLRGLADTVPLLRCRWTAPHFEYERLWRYVLEKEPRDSRWLPGAFVDWDDTSRRGSRGTMCQGVTPDKFEKYLTAQILRARDVYHSDKLFLFAWNEWGEAGYLEPDERHGYGMLEAVRNALSASREL